MKRDLVPLLGVALAAALIATGFFYGLLIPRLRGTGEAAATRQVLVAQRYLDRGTVVRAEDFDRVRLPDGTAPPNAPLAVEEAVGRTLLEPLLPRQPLTLAALAPRGSAGGASLAIPAGMRAVCIHPSESSGVVALLRSGGRVDVQVLEPRATGGPRLRRLLENVEVLSAPASETMRSGKPAVTLLVSPHDADRLSLADAALSVRLVLRNPADSASEGPLTLSTAALAASP